MKTDLYKSFIFLVSFLASVYTFAGNDTIQYRSTNLPDNTFFDKVFSNPSSTFFRPDAFDHGHIEFSYDHADRKKLHFLQEGESSNAFGIQAEGLTVKGNKIFWGKAGYKNSKTKNVQWSDVSDVSRLGPYIIADSIGGDSYAEKYFLSGGLSLQYNKWAFGAEAGYEAGNEYRKTDPRPQATATDIFAKLSVDYNLYKDYRIGLSGQAGRYQQDLSIKIHRDKTRHNFFVLKGFGMYHMQLSSYDTSFGWRYEGNNYGASLFFFPEKNGFLGNSTIQYEYIDSKPSSSESRRPFTLKTTSWKNQIGWQQVSPTNKSLIKLDYNYTIGKGIERIYYYQRINEVYGEYFLLYSGRFYTKELTDLKLSGYHEWISSKNSKWVQASVGLNTYEERYVYPVYKISFDHLITSLEVGGEFRTSKVSTLVPRLKYSYLPLLSSKEVILEKSDLIDLAFMPDIDVFKADLMGIDAGLTYEYRLKNTMQLYASGNGNYLFDGSRNRFQINLAIGFKY